MKIKDRIAKLKIALNELAKDATWSESLYYESGGVKVRGPHINIMVPASDDVPVTVFGAIAHLFNVEYCDIKWDGQIKKENCIYTGGIYKGKYYKIVLDIV